MGKHTTYYLDGFLSEPNGSQGLKEAKGRYELYTKAPAYILPNQIIVGDLNKALSTEAVVNATSQNHLNHGIINEILNSNNYNDGYRAELSQKLDKIKPYVLYETINNRSNKEEQAVEESGAALCQHYNGHMVMDYEFVLSKGLTGVQEKIAYYEAKNVDASDFYEALSITLSGMKAFILKHASLAEELINSNDARYDKNWLELIAQNCRHISCHVPETFLQAVQLQWFIMQFADYDSFGRYDQYMYPLYKKETDAGTLTRDEAKDHIKDMLRRVDENGNIINMTIGGITPSGEDGVNELTYILLEATRELNFKGPNLCLRIRPDSDERLWREVGISLSTGQSLPALYNDERFISMFMAHGVSEQDANDFCLAGCSQAIIPAKSNYSCDMGLYTPAKMLELALFNGFDHRIQKQVGPETGEAVNFQSYEMLYDAYTAQMKYCVKHGVALNNLDNDERKGFLSCVRSMFTQGCIEKGLGIFDGGAIYYGVQGEIVGLTNTANSLMAIKTLVFDEKKLTMEQLLQALVNNFEGYEDIRHMLKHHCDKYGNDLDEVDAIRAKITEEIYKEIASYTDDNGGVHWPGEVIFTYHYDMGKRVLASPDGRMAYTPLADSAGASQGTDLHGPTGILNSVAKVPSDLLCTSINVNLKFPKSLWNDHQGKILQLFKVYFQSGGCQLQVNVVNKEDLVNAMKNPEQYRGLIVRVGGFSAYFTQLLEEQQLEIISRTELSI